LVDSSDAIRAGASAYMYRQYRTIAVVAVFIMLGFALVAGSQTGVERTQWIWITAGFGVGALFSAISGYVGMHVAVRANVRVAQAARGGLSRALGLAFNGGAVAGLAVAGPAVVGFGCFVSAVSSWCSSCSSDSATRWNPSSVSRSGRAS